MYVCIYVIYYLIFVAVTNLKWCQVWRWCFHTRWPHLNPLYRQMALLDQMVWGISTCIQVSREEWGEPSDYTNLYDGRCGWRYFSRRRQEEIPVSKGQIWETFREGKETLETRWRRNSRLVHNCTLQYGEYDTLHNNMIRDWIVIGIKDSSLLERMQLDDILTLEKVTKTVRQSETMKSQQS